MILCFIDLCCNLVFFVAKTSDVNLYEHYICEFTEGTGIISPYFSLSLCLSGGKKAKIGHRK